MLPAAAVAAPTPQPYQQNDFGGFLNVLPPGQNGLVNGPQLLAFQGDNSQRPPHNDDQLGMYSDLVHGAPNLQEADLPKYFKDASFGVRPDDVERTYSPRDDVTIVRDKGFGTPHVYGETREGVMFGAGYAAAEDRLFFIDVLRHLGRAQLSSFAGGAEGNQAFDAEQWRIAPYTEDDLQRQVDQLDDLYGAEGAQIQQDLDNYVAGVNAYIAEAKLNPTLMPGEYVAINRPQGPDEWNARDVIATAALVGGIFGKGGGRELLSANMHRQARVQFGKKEGLGVWRDLRSAEDPEAPTTVHRKRFPYMLTRRVRKGTRAMPDFASVKTEPIVEGAGGADGEGIGFGDDCPQAEPICFTRAQSNALVVSARESQSGHPLAVFGPQAAYFAPQILMDQDLHGPGIDARGASFPGVNLYVQLGRGPDYAWSATSAGQDNTDTFAVDLCDPDGGEVTIDSTGYMFGGECRPMEALTRENSWTPSAADQTPAGSATLTAHRTVLGIVEARATIKGQPVAYTVLRSTYMHEVDSARGFVDFNDPDKMRTPRAFMRAAYKIGYTFNWLYVDDRNVAYFNSGNNPVRAPRTDPNFPVRARPDTLWRGFDPENNTARYTPFRKHPRVINQRYLTSWNNKQARGYRSADSQWGFGSVYRSLPLDDRIRRATKGRRKMSLTDLVNAMGDAATVDLRGAKALPLALKLIGRPPETEMQDAVTKLRAWVRDGAHRRDLDNDGAYEHADAIRIMDAFWPVWMENQFDDLGPDLFDNLERMLPIDNPPNNHGDHLGSAYQDGWWGYVSKDLRTILGRKVKGRYSRRYCGNGTRKSCRKVLRKSLQSALALSDPQTVYGDDQICADAGRAGDQKCFDSIRFRPLGAVTQPLIDWQNRPTFQQVVEVQGHR
jgi:acyl-homoserine lactone acylase PvdQ